MTELCHVPTHKKVADPKTAPGCNGLNMYSIYPLKKCITTQLNY